MTNAPAHARGGSHDSVRKTVKTDVQRLDDAEYVRELNRLGDEGWALVASVPHERHGYSHELYFVFSRPREGAAA